MTIKRLIAATIMLATPFALGACAARAQDGPPPPSGQQGATAPAPNAPSQGGRPDHGDRAWGPRHEWNRSDRDRRNRGMGHGRMGDWAGGESMLPFGLWWKDSQVAARLGLTADQQKRISDMFLESRLELIHQHATLQEEQLMLGPLLSATPFDEVKAMTQIDKIADTRAELEKTNAKMLLNIRGVLTAEQWTKLRDRRHGMQARGDWGDQDSQGPPRSN